MESAHQGINRAFLSAELPNQTAQLTGSRSISVLSQFPACFPAPGKTVRRGSVEIKDYERLKTSGNAGKEALLPDIYSAMKQVSKGKTRLTTAKSEAEIGEVAVLPAFAVRRTPTRDKQSKPESGKFWLQGISVESSLLRLPKAKCTPAARTSGIHFKQKLQLGGNSGIGKRATLAAIDPAPVITLSLVEHREEESAGKAAVLSPKQRLQPAGLQMLRRNSEFFSANRLRLSSPLMSSASSDYSSNDSGNFSASDRSPKDAITMSKLGVWSPWASHLSPFQNIIEAAGRNHTKIYQYLKKVRKNLPESKFFLRPIFRPKRATLDNCILCTCRNPLSARNLRNFLVQGISSQSLKQSTKELSHLQTIIAARPEKVKQRVLLIQVDGVLADVRKIGPFDLSSVQYVLRPEVIEGLNSISQGFSIVLLSALAPFRFQKILDYFIQCKIPILAAYSIEPGEELLSDATSRSFLDYKSVYFDLGIRENEVSARILVLSALLSETISGQIMSEKDVFYSESGLRIRINALHLPTTLPSQPSPAVTLLIPHLRLEDYKSALQFTSIAREIELLSQGSKSRKWTDSFEYLEKCAVSVHLAYVRTYKVLEAYFAYLLPCIRSEEWTRITSISLKKGPCQVHPCSQQVSKPLPESRLLLLTSPDPSHLLPCQALDFEPFLLTSEAVTLLTYTTSDVIR